VHIYEIVDHNGKVVEHVRANTEKQALCIYIANHAELVDVMLWYSNSNIWKLAEYDDEENFMFARWSHNI
jgi:hypothetical protein